VLGVGDAALVATVDGTAVVAIVVEVDADGEVDADAEFAVGAVVLDATGAAVVGCVEPDELLSLAHAATSVSANSKTMRAFIARSCARCADPGLTAAARQAGVSRTCDP
jgi:hypothetical protein